MNIALREHFKIAFLAAVLMTVGCSDDSFSSKTGTENGFNNNQNNSGEGGRNNQNQTNNRPPEQEFEFAQPTVVGNDVYIANESLNTVAVVDSNTLLVRTLPVGFRPTIVAGPTGQSTEESRVFVLNEGSESVSVITPGGSQSTHKVLRSTNRLVSGPLGRSAIAWVDPSQLDQDERFSGRIDLAAVTLLRDDGAFQISVGFNIRDIVYDESGDQVFVLTDDGVSVFRPEEVTDDQIAPPIRYAPSSEFAAIPPAALETRISPQGDYAFTRTANGTALVQLEIETGEYSVVHFPTQPTDIDFVSDDRLLIMLGNQSLALIATIPDGIENAAIASADVPVQMPDMGMNTGDAGTSDMGMDDAGTSDMGMNDAGTTGTDMGGDMADMAAADMGMDDAGADMASVDAGTDAGATDMGFVENDFPFEADEVDWLEMPVPGLVFATVDDAGTTALFHRPTSENRSVLLNLQTLEMRGVLFEKPVAAAVAGPDGEAFVVYHRREGERLDPNLTPADPEYIEQSWGISLLDVKSGANRLILTDFEPGPATIFEAEGTRRLYMLFGGLGANQNRPSTVLTSDLISFVTDDFDVASPPEEIGTILAAGRVYVSQRHPQGRLTLVDVENEDRRQTITGYQLNAGID